MSTPFRSSSSPHNIAKWDAEYLDAVKRGDMETAKFNYMKEFADRFYAVKDVVRDALTADGKTKDEAEKFVSFDKASPCFANRVQGGMAEHDLVRARALRDNLV